jgi:hypothetical protein
LNKIWIYEPVSTDGSSNNNKNKVIEESQSWIFISLFYLAFLKKVGLNLN